jgi:hypothetical protein
MSNESKGDCSPQHEPAEAISATQESVPVEEDDERVTGVIHDGGGDPL